ncbi:MULTISPECIES: sn-glycerol-3-phosphate ABC transporter ATP-binding protein UgpC [Acidithrix]|uniref:Trehalose import ATP-binding protein SugC n=1 Tax=Acidithrix ferrooxidans TaxID=1280514 RepID=A0A0D8HLD2_9ACTN|nr:MULTISPECIES: sn-glycerol-3-phosphate ABC transporter ATP-binding protein UgpC [Acidithrix]KJF18743.1 trehalose import ATP-binding protein SugC [Acidithrix ferrooxidans]CAG4931734.1 unnamed protein product [Acidithrix sp. C25]
MANVTLDRLSKTYANGYVAVRELNLEVSDGEFLILVGPSGCGKTTALRMVAGLETITSGELRVGGKRVNETSPKERNIAMVFQNYALYPHMTVAENIGFALKLQKLSKDQIEAKVKEAAAKLSLTEYLDRKPAQLSGGQRQRVAMGRALVRDPAVFLMDEPLSNLDAKLRVQMRAEVSRIQRALGTATIYVTHDQVEAMTMGDRVAVMNGGILQQIDTPSALYNSPKNLFVAAFIGSPSMNLYHATIAGDLTNLTIGSQKLALSPGLLKKHSTLTEYRDRKVIVGIRPEDLALNSSSQEATNRLRVKVDISEVLGSEILAHFQIEATSVKVEGETPEEDKLDEIQLDNPGNKYARGVARLSPDLDVTAGSYIDLTVNIEKLHFFDPDSGDAI